MAKEPSSMGDTATSPSSSSTADSYIGSFISVTSKCEIRYEGFLYFLNTQDATFGLKDVRSYGTEGRNKNGQQVPASDKVYEYILFRASDIKDLHVINTAPVQTREPIYNDPAIIQSNSCVGPPSSSKSVSATVGSLGEYNLYTEPAAPNARSYQSISPAQPSGNQSWIWGPSPLTHNSASRYGISTQWPGYDASNISNNISPGCSNATSSSIYLTATSTLSSEQLSTPFTNPVPSKPSFPIHYSTLTNSNGLSMPSSLTCQNKTSIMPQVVDNVVSDPSSLLPVHSVPYSVPSASVPVVNPQQVLLTPNLSQTKPSEPSLSSSLYTDQKDISIMSSANLSYSTPSATPAVELPLLSLPPPSQKVHSLQFTEEFDFQAMNEKFNKDEVWGYLGKANQREKLEGIKENGTSTLDLGGDESELISKTDTKTAYNKDDFFDTISCHSVGRGTRNGQNRFSDRIKLDSQTFGNFQRRPQFGYGGGHRGGGRGDHHGSYNYWQRGHNYGHRGRGGGGYMKS